MAFGKRCFKFSWLLCLFLLMFSACTPMIGNPSLTLISRDIKPDSAQLELIDDTTVEETETMYWALIFLMVGERPTHESVVSRLLEKYNADVLVDAELYSSQYGIPGIFMMMSTTAEGKPARIKSTMGKEAPHE